MRKTINLFYTIGYSVSLTTSTLNGHGSGCALPPVAPPSMIVCATVLRFVSVDEPRCFLLRGCFGIFTLLIIIAIHLAFD